MRDWIRRPNEPIWRASRRFPARRLACRRGAISRPQKRVISRRDDYISVAARRRFDRPRPGRNPGSKTTQLDRLGRYRSTAFRARDHDRHDRRGDAPLLPRLRDERDRGAGAPRHPRRAEAGASPHPLFDADKRQSVEPRLPQIRPHRRRRDGQIPSAWRSRDLRCDGAAGSGLLDAPAADRRPGQFRLDGRRFAGGQPLHRGAPRPGHRVIAR